jgi:hypothetical protein
MGDSIALPVVAGLAIGIMFVSVMFFSLYASPVPANSGSPLRNSDDDHIVIMIENLKDTYRASEPVSFSVNTKGVSGNLCNHPEPSVIITDIDEDKVAWSTPPTFQIVMGCGNIQGIDREWRFGYAGEELPFQSSLSFDHEYGNSIAFEKAGLYRIMATFEDNVVEKEFAVVSRSDSGM